MGDLSVNGGRLLRGALLILLLSALLTATATADMGPKPQLVVRVTHAPEGVYYLDLLAKDAPGGAEARSGGGKLTEEELAALDPALLQALRDAVPEGWHACLLEGNGAPLWRSLEPGAVRADGTGVHTFGYWGLPARYRLLLAAEGGEVRVSEVGVRRVLQSAVTYDWARNTLSSRPTAWALCLQFLSTWLPTLLIEGAVLLWFRFSLRKNWLAFLLANTATQLYLTWAVVWRGVALRTAPFLALLPTELVILAIEAAVYHLFLKPPVAAAGEETAPALRRFPVIYAVAANLASFLAGLLAMRLHISPF